MIKSTRRMLIGACAASACWLALAGPASAATISNIVSADNLTDDSSCTLREAINTAFNDTDLIGGDSMVDCDYVGDPGGPDTIQLNTFNYKIELTGTGDDSNLTGDFDIDAGTGLTIDGAGSALIDGDHLDRVLQLKNGTLTLTNGLTVSNGTAPASASGGGILTEGTSNLNITNSTVSANSAPAGGAGIQVSSTGTTTLSGAHVSGNQVTTSSGGGGGIAVGSTGASNLTITNSRINNNTVTGTFGAGAGFIYNPSAVSTLNVSNSLIDSNSSTSTASVTSGGVHVNAPDGSTVSFTQDVIRNNSAVGSGATAPAEAGGIRFNNGGGTITDSIIRNNQVAVDPASSAQAGAIFVGGDTVRIVRSTLSGNSLMDGAQTGGAIENEGNLVLLNSTISGNSAVGGAGGALRQDGAGATTTAVNTSFVNNVASTANAISRTGGTVTVRGSVIDNFGQAGDACAAGAVTSAGYNVGSDMTCSLTGTGDEQGMTGLVLALTNNSLAQSPHAGPSFSLETIQTHLPGASSTVRDQIPAMLCTDDGGMTLLATDQRNIPRPFDGNNPADGTADCDAGSVESALCVGAEATMVGTAAGDMLTGTAAQDVILGLNGNDTLAGAANGDRLCGNDGNDTLDGGDTNTQDQFDGGPGTDDEVTYAASGGDIEANLTTGTTVNTGVDLITTGTVENLRGGTGANLFTGDGANNDLRGGAGDDNLIGEGGDDLLDGEANGMLGDGAQYPNATSTVTASLQAGSASGTGQGTDTLMNLENLRGSPQADNLTGDGLANVIEGAAGLDTITGLGGMDTLAGENDGASIFARDGVQDNVNCGGGATDSAQVDQAGVDLVDPSCETVDFFVPPVATPPATTPTSPTATTAPKKCPKGRKLKKGKCVKKKKKKK